MDDPEPEEEVSWRKAMGIGVEVAGNRVFWTLVLLAILRWLL